MPHVLALVIAGAGLYAGYKWVRRVMADGQAKTPVVAKDLGTLEYDAETRAYRPRAK